MLLTKTAPVLLGALATFSLFTGACATKKHVREAVAPVQNQVNEVGKKTDQNTTSIGDLDRNVAKVDEKAMEADRKAGAAGDAARQAGQAASQAQQTATGAQTLAQQSIEKVGKVETATNNLMNTVNNLDNFKLQTTEKVYFKVNRSELTKDEKEKLDQAVNNVQNAKNYVIEVEGYTDRTGAKSMNLDLSKRRADAVVRYLTVEKNIPLRKIHEVGVGADFPNAVNKTRADRQENRRVDVKIYTLNNTGAQMSAQTPMPARTAQQSPQQ